MTLMSPRTTCLGTLMGAGFAAARDRVLRAGRTRLLAVRLAVALLVVAFLAVDVLAVDFLAVRLTGAFALLTRRAFAGAR